MKDIDLDAHIINFFKKIRANGKIVEGDIINLFGFTLWNNGLEWGKNFTQDHHNCTFEELEQTFYKPFWTMKNDE